LVGTGHFYFGLTNPSSFLEIFSLSAYTWADYHLTAPISVLKKSSGRPACRTGGRRMLQGKARPWVPAVHYWALKEGKVLYEQKDQN